MKQDDVSRNQPKVILITGASSGMGLALSKRLAREGHRVFMLCRNEQRGRAALEQVRAESGNSEVHLVLCDLGSLEDIQRFARQFLEAQTRLDVLINNAGVILPKRRETTDGFELQFGVNHLGHFLLTLRLMPLIQASPEGRIIIVSSGAHKIGNLHLEDIHMKRRFSVFRAYSRSKLANMLFGFELGRRLSGSRVTVNMLHPGAVATNMGINRETGFGRGFTRLLKPFFQSPDEGADTAYYLAVSPEVQGLSGRYFIKRRVVSPAPRAMDVGLARELWDISERMVGLTWQDVNRASRVTLAGRSLQTAEGTIDHTQDTSVRRTAQEVPALAPLSCNPVLSGREYVFVSDKSFSPETRSAAWAVIHEEEGITLILTRDTAEEFGLDFQGVFRRMTLEVYSSLNAVGLTAAVSKALAELNISANMIAGFHHDHVFVPRDQADQALRVVQGLRLSEGQVRG